MMSSTPARNGENTSVPTDLIPDVRVCPFPLASRVMMVTEMSSRTTRVVSVRRDRLGRGTPRFRTGRSAGRGGDEHPLERLELLQALAAADGHAVQRVSGHHQGHAGLVLQPGVQAVEQCAAAGEDDALL